MVFGRLREVKFSAVIDVSVLAVYVENTSERNESFQDAYW